MSLYKALNKIFVTKLQSNKISIKVYIIIIFYLTFNSFFIIFLIIKSIQLYIIYIIINILIFKICIMHIFFIDY